MRTITEHPILDRLHYYHDFYITLSDNMTDFLEPEEMYNIDTFTLLDIVGTISSLQQLVRLGLLNDTLVLLQKFEINTAVHLYATLKISEYGNHFSKIDDQLERWVTCSEDLPLLGEVFDFVLGHRALIPLRLLLDKDNAYDLIRERITTKLVCNYFGYTHLNFHFTCDEVDEEKWAMLNQLLEDLDNLFIQHVASLFYIDDRFMVTDTFQHQLAVGIIPPLGYKPIVPNFIREVFEFIIIPVRPDIFNLINSNSGLDLEVLK